MQVANRRKKVGASLKVDVDIPIERRKNANHSNKDIQLFGWVRYSTIESAFDLYSCTKLETEPQRKLTSRSERSPWQKNHWSDLSARVPSTATPSHACGDRSGSRQPLRGISNTWLAERKLASFFVPRPTTRARDPPTETLTRRGTTQRPRSSTTSRGSKIVTQDCDIIVGVDDFSTKPASPQPSSTTLPMFWCPSSLELQLSNDLEESIVAETL